MELPDYTGASLPIVPPFQFGNVMVSMFPLRADPAALQRYCDSYLNIVPPELGHFRPALPYVQLMLLDYGKLNAQATNLGWFSQREVMFSVPVEWYKLVDGRYVFHGWASVAPFIYVDAETSMLLGRTAMGWPKSLVNLSPSLSGWVRDPSGSTIDVAISARVFGKAYAGARMEEQPVMIVRSPMPSSWRVPFDPEGPLMPWTMWSTMAESMTAFAGDAFNSMAGMLWPPSGQGSSLAIMASKTIQAGRLGLSANPWSPNLLSYSLNLKQFRLADQPSQLCYQSLTNGPMRFTAFHRGGLLGTPVRGPSGGYTIDIAGWPNFPIVETLGLEAEVYTSASGPDIWRLHPVFPVWYNVDMEYQRTERLAFRTDKQPAWHDSEARKIVSARGGESDTFFNTVTGAASPVITGPFRFPSATVTVMPLLARLSTLQDFVDRTLNAPLSSTGERFDVWAGSASEHAYVYLLTVDAGDVASDTNSIGDWDDLSILFYIPVQRMMGGQLVDSGLFPAYAFASGTTQTCTMGELYGYPMVEARFSRLAHEWDGSDAHAPRSLLRVVVESLPALHEGARAEHGTLVELTDRGLGVHVENAPLSDTGERFCRLLRAEVERKNALDEGLKAAARARALELLTLETPLHVYTFKQFRHAGRADKACYQALVRIPYTFTDVQHIGELERLASVELSQRAAFPVVEDLGLIAREVSLQAGVTVHKLEAVRPFRVRAGVRLGNGSELYSRASLDWTPERASAQQLALLRAQLRERLPGELADELSVHHHCQLKVGVLDWLARQDHAESTAPATQVWPSWRAQVDPQTVLESILSREWEDGSSSSTLHARRTQLTRNFARAEAGWGSWLSDNLGQLAERSATDVRLVRWLRRLEEASLRFDRGDDVGEKLPPQAAEEGWSLLSEHNWIHILANGEHDLEGLDDTVSERIRDASLRLIRTQRSGVAFPALWRELSAGVRELLALLFPIATERLERALDRAVYAGKKPDHCVLRATAGASRERLFPSAHSWQGRWWSDALAQSGEQPVSTSSQVASSSATPSARSSASAVARVVLPSSPGSS